METVPLISYSDFVVILLTALGVILAALGVLFTIATLVLGGLAFFGYHQMIGAAKKRIEDVISQYPTPEVFQAQATEMLNNIVKGLVPSLVASQTEENPSNLVAEPSTGAVASEPISLPYPEKEVQNGPNEDASSK